MRSYRRTASTVGSLETVMSPHSLPDQPTPTDLPASGRVTTGARLRFPRCARSWSVFSRGEAVEVVHESDQHFLAGRALPGVALDQRNVFGQVERLPDVLRPVLRPAEVVAGDDERHPVVLETVDGV